MFYTGQSVEVLRGQYKGIKGIVTNYAGLNTFFTIQKEDGTKLKVHYKDMLEFNTANKREVGDLAFLRKGIEILEHTNVNNKNMRALGYSIPSLKNFGFGALCFTWRNVPNNTPLVFWYAGGGFTPLFVVSRGVNPFADFIFAND